MTTGAPRAGPYFAPRLSSSGLHSRAQDEIKRLTQQVQELKAQTKELIDKNEKLITEAAGKDQAMEEMSEKIERLRLTMGGICGGDMMDGWIIAVVCDLDRNSKDRVLWWSKISIASPSLFAMSACIILCADWDLCPASRYQSPCSDNIWRT